MLNYQDRLTKTQAQMREQGINLLFLPRSANLNYLTGLPRDEPNFGNAIFPGEWLTGAWIPQEGAPILTLPRMLAEFHLGEVTGYDIRILPDAGDPIQLVKDVLKQFALPRPAKVALEDRAWVESVLNLQRLLPDLEFSQASAILMPLRVIKDEAEIAVMKKAGQITEAAYQASLGQLRHGMTNLDLITEVNYQIKKQGGFTNSFVTGFYNMGKNYPFDFHNREEVLLVPLEPPVAVSYDMGAAYEDYCYDYGRSVFFGEPDAEYHRCYQLVMDAQAAGIAALKMGNTCEQADAAARDVITAGGYGEAFRHRLGHAIGLDVHETPFLTAGDATALRLGMCFTAEPSIFIPHHLGARVEDVIVVGENDGEALTNGFQPLHIVD